MTNELRAILAGRDDPVRVTVGALKGGVGKSTTAVHLALALADHSDVPVMLVDADPVNASTFEWADFVGEDWPSQVSVNYWPSANLAKRLRDSRHTGHVVIDTGPSDPAILRQALMVTDHLVVPVAPTPAEVSRIRPTLEAAAEVGYNRDISLSLLFTRVKPNTRSLRDAREAMEEQQLHALATAVPFVLQYSQAFGTVPDDLGVYPTVLTEILERAQA